jgi:sugar transferase (PEP-CTERM/EpsH1 system associated)
MNQVVTASDAHIQNAGHMTRPKSRQSGPLRVLHVLNRLATGGTENVVLRLIDGLNEEIFEHRLAAVRGMDPAFGGLELPGGELLLDGKEDSGFEFLILRLARVMRAYRPHIVHSRNWGTIEAIPAARLARVPVVIHSEHGYDLDMLTGLPRRRRIFRRASYAMADAVFAVTRELRDFHARQAWISPERIRVIYNGVDTQRFHPRPEERVSLRRRFGLPEQRFIVGTVGRTVAIKDHPTLLRAVESMVLKGIDAHALLVGSGPELERNQMLAKDSAALAGRVTFVGSCDEVPDILNTMDVFALTSISEGMSNTLLEAMATALPVIATNVGGNPEVIVDGDSGWLFEPRDSEALGSRLMSLASDENQRRQLSLAARQRIVERFSLPSMLNDYSNLYLELAARRGIKLQDHQAR